MDRIKKAFITSIPVLMGYIVLGFAFGILLKSKGYPIYYALIMSVFIYAGSMQFVAIDLLTSGASLLSSAIMTLLINARHIVYGLSMLKKYQKMGRYKPYMIFSLTDETYSLLVSETSDDRLYLFLISFFNQCYWVMGSLLGASVGSIITINTTGLDFAMTALFIVIVINQFLENKDHRFSYIGFVVSIICLLLFGASSFIIPSIIIIIICLLLVNKVGVNHES